MKEILLTQDQVALVDDEDYYWLNQYCWKASYDFNTQSFYAYGHDTDGKYLNMARLIVDCPDNKQADHFDHETLNNQKANLRICNSSQNQQNRRVTGNGTSKYKGVSQQGGRWRARIGLQDIFGDAYAKCLGTFNIEEEAALAYDDAAAEHFGEFAYLNFPRQVNDDS